MPRLNIKNIAQSLFILVSVAFLLNWLASNWTIVQSAWATISWAAMVASFALLALSFLFLPTSMLLFMRAGQAEISYFQSGRAFYGSQLTKYLPGGVWVFPSRLVIMKEMGFDLTLSTIALGFEMVTMLISSLVVSWATLGPVMGQIWRIEWQVYLGVASIGAACVAIMAPELFEWGQSFLGWRGNSLINELPKSLQIIKTIPIIKRTFLLFSSILIYSIMWLLAGLSFYILVITITEAVGWQMIPLTIGVFTFAWLVGFLTVFSPGGIGVREGVIVLLLGTLVSSPYLMLIALFSRILWSLAEILFLVIFLFFVE
jgi:uncharacterized membrane protein YbhN (UPF0104 family)